MAGEHVREAAAGLAALPPDDPQRRAADAHAAGCAECARALREAERLQALLGEAAPEVGLVPPEWMARAAESIVADLRREERRRWTAGSAAILASLLVFVGLARQRSRDGADWILAVVLGCGALALAATATRRALVAVGGALAAAFLGAGLLGGPGALGAAGGIDCVATEVAGAAAAVGATWLVLRAGATRPPLLGVAGLAAAGALAGDAALQLTCRAHASLPHLLLFHAGGVLVAAVAAAVAWRFLPRAAR